MVALTILFMTALMAPLQRIETQYPDRTRVTQVETALNHLTVIELAEPVTLAAAGSPLFKIERRDKKVFIQPLEDGVSTNLFVWTESGRWAYELIPAKSIETMHFAIDQQAPPALQTSNAVSPGLEAPGSVAFPSLAEEMLVFARPIRAIGVKPDTNDVALLIRDVYRRGAALYVRYVIDNRSTQSYVTGQPEAFVLDPISSKTSIHALRYSQIGPGIERQIKSKRETRIAIIDCEVPAEPIPPGVTTAGMLTLQFSGTSEPAVLRIVFPGAGRKPASITLVL